MSDTLEYKGYFGNVEYSKADNIFFGRILGITDSVTYEGDTIQSLQQDFEDAVEDYFDACIELNKEPEKSYESKLNLRIHPDLHRKLVYFSTVRNQTLEKTVEDAIGQYVTL